MTSRDFCYWLQGYFEIVGEAGRRTFSEAQMKCIKQHLALVFKHEIDPSMGGAAHQADLNAIHDAIGNAIKKHETTKPHAKPQPWVDPSPKFRC